MDVIDVKISLIKLILNVPFMFLTEGETRASLILQEGHDSFDLLNQIKRIYDYGYPLKGKDIFTTPFQTRMNHCVSAFIKS